MARNALGKKEPDGIVCGIRKQGGSRLDGERPVFIWPVETPIL
jgi:hypothetical protein